jgi:anti-sigma factor RsiW
MTCREVVELMTDYLEGTLPSADRARFEGHIAGCDGCRAYLDQMRTTRGALVALGEESVPQPLRDELLKAFRGWRSS